MRRRLEICRKCSCLRHVKKSSVGNWYCSREALFDRNGEEIGVAWDNMYWSHDWNRAEVPEDCDYYAEYFVRECNEEKA